MGLAERLERKGWSKAEIDHAVSHMDESRKNRSLKTRVFEESIYWLNIFILAASNVAISWFLFPFLSQLPRSLSLSIAAVLGVLWGVLIGHLGHEVARLEPQRHSLVLFTAALTVAFTALAVGSYSVVLSVVFSGTFVVYYSYLWWHHAS
jgi:hypothetical protein